MLINRKIFFLSEKIQPYTLEDIESTPNQKTDEWWFFIPLIDMNILEGRKAITNDQIIRLKQYIPYAIK